MAIATIMPATAGTKYTSATDSRAGADGVGVGAASATLHRSFFITGSAISPHATSTGVNLPQQTGS